ncbi:MAG TPA: hypothetical protein PKK91_08390, partial [bacterium]|nr:hypothetical protein [bacterium]
ENNIKYSSPLLYLLKNPPHPLYKRGKHREVSQRGELKILPDLQGKIPLTPFTKGGIRGRTFQRGNFKYSPLS